MLCFEKAIYKIVCRADDNDVQIKDVEGYVFDYGKYRFGICKSNSLWILTDIKSGLLCGLASKTRKGIEDVLESWYGQKILKIIDKQEELYGSNRQYTKIVDTIAEAYKVM